MKTYSKRFPIALFILLLLSLDLCAASFPVLPDHPFFETSYNDRPLLPNLTPEEDKPLFMIFKELGIKSTPDKTRVVISKQDHVLMIFSGTDFIKSYPARISAYGMNDKLTDLDYLTPEGIFYLAMRYDSTTYRSFYGFMGLSYPNTEDAIRGIRQQRINNDIAVEIISNVLSRKTDRNKGSDWMGNGLWSGRVGLGGQVGIHGQENPKPQNGDTTFAQLGGDYKEKARKRVDWTLGCIALSNAAIDEIRSLSGGESWEKYATPVLIVRSLSEISNGLLARRFESFLENPDPFVDTGSLGDIEIPEGLKKKLDEKNLLERIETSAEYIRQIQ